VNNIVIEFLQRHPDRIPGNQAPDKWTCVIATPRFKASGHLIFFLLPQGSAAPTMIAKVPRLPGEAQRLELESQNLCMAAQLKEGGFEAVPKIIAYDTFHGYRLLVETAVPGQTMRPAFVKRHRTQCLELGLGWLLEFHQASLRNQAGVRGQAAQTIMSRMANLESLSALSESDERCVAKSMRIARDLQAQHLPTVFEHGDFSSPNLLISATGQLGVVDWELANDCGLPGPDLFFFLSYIGFAVAGATQQNEKYMAAFQSAFFSRDAWALPYIRQYWQGLGLDRGVASGLFVLCWAKYVSSLLDRLAEGSDRGSQFTRETLGWIRSNRYYKMWRYAVENLDQLHLVG